MSDNPDVLVIGAGVAGLTAAREIASAGLKVTLIEARNRIGGRIYTDHSAGYPVELGAEFMHGCSPHLLDVASQARLSFAEMEGEFRRKRDGIWGDSGDVMHEVNHLFENMPAQEPDRSFRHYIDHTSHKEETRRLALNFVEGFHASDPERVSVHWLIRATRAEKTINGETSFRFGNGYDGIVNAIGAQIDGSLCKTLLNAQVREIHWRRGEVVACQADGERSAPRAVLTLPLGVLKAGRVRFDPPLEGKQLAMNDLEMGPVIRVSLCFREKFWEEKPETRNLSFLFTDDPEFPTWWTSNPLPFPLLTGWAAGKFARALGHLGKDELIQRAVWSLSRILEVNLKSKLHSGLVHDWQADPLSCGAYSYVVIGGSIAPGALAAPVKNTLFFAGEATNTEGHNGTVHGAIQSGKRAARELLSTMR